MRHIPWVVAAGMALGWAAGCGGDATRCEIVDELVAAREEGGLIAPLTSTYGRFTVSEAYLIQDALTARLVLARGDPVAGYKIGYASKASQQAWGIDEPAYGRLFESQRVPDGGTIRADEFNGFHIETEVAFIIGKRISRPVETIEELRKHVRGVAVGFDIPDARYDETRAPQTVADIVAAGVGAHRFVLGPRKDPETVNLDEVVGKVLYEGKVVYEGAATNVMGSPWEALKWLANALVARGFALEKGDVVLSGALDKAYGGPKDAIPGTYVGTAGKLGKVKVNVVE